MSLQVISPILRDMLLSLKSKVIMIIVVVSKLDRSLFENF
jgi:hypothetical protein